MADKRGLEWRDHLFKLINGQACQVENPVCFSLFSLIPQHENTPFINVLR
jgi:hypothetical protein